MELRVLWHWVIRCVYQKAMFYNLVNSLNAMEATENDLKSFKEFLEKECKDPT